MSLPNSARGFSLIEIIVAIIIMSIISIGLVDFITNSASSYTQSAARNQVSAAGRIVIDRIAMELHNALPESIRISPVLTSTNPSIGNAGDQCLEFIPVEAATTYLNPAFRPGDHVDTFEVVDFVPAQIGRTDLYAVIYPVSEADLYGASFVGGASGATEAIARVKVSDVPPPVLGDPPTNKDRITTHISGDPDESYEHRFKRRSEVQRLFLTDEPVSFCISGSKLYRYKDYGFSADQLLPRSPDGNCAAGPAADDCLPAQTPGRELLTDQLDNSALTGSPRQAFDQQTASRRRNAVIQLELNFSLQGQQVLLNHEILQQTTP